MTPETARTGTYATLESLLESAKLLNSTLNLDDLLGHLLRTVMGRYLIARGVVAIQGPNGRTVHVSRGVPSLKKGAAFSPEAARAAGLEIFFDIGTEGEEMGVLALGKSARGPLHTEETEFVRALTGMAASVVANALSHRQAVALNTELDQKIQELRALLDLVRGLAATLDPDEIAGLLMLTFAGRWAVTRCGVATWKEGQPPVRPRRGLDLTRLEQAKERVAALADASVVTGADAADLGIPEGSLVMPIRSGGGTCGAVVCGPRMRGGAYTADDLEFGAGLVAQAAVAFDNAWHFRDTIGKKQMEKELALAAGIQLDLFPKELPALRATDISARNRQARQVGGDYYDVIPVGPARPAEEHLVCVVDISGKGIFASLLMSNIQATLRALVSRESSLPIVAQTANDLLYATTPSNRYATAFQMIYEAATGACRWINCGHTDGIVVRADGSVEMLECNGIALGLFPARTYDEVPIQLRAGDLMAIYSDGVTDAQNEAEEEFGTERLVEVLKTHASVPAESVVDRVFEAIDAHAGTAPQFDDITMMVLKRVE
ncbi:MAG: PP2C family protein-serine/threonine phosphatase [Acidobacteriota bacterium]|nr:PP2C family protein-serine/threonine phosphatase [Acidobacteriota bacterium]